MSAFATTPDHQLISELHELVRGGRAHEAQLLSHLAEVDKRRLYLGEACSSMFRYCVDVLHFSEASAFKRIGAARAARDFPEVLDAVRQGELHVTAVRLLAPHIDSGNCAELIALAKHRTADQIKRLLADRQPKPDVAASVRRVSSLALSAPRETNANSDSPFHAEPTTRPLIPPRPPINPSPKPTSKPEPLGGDRYSIRFSADRETHAQLRELQALMRHKFPDGDLGAILGHAVAALHKQVRKQKFADCEKPRVSTATETECDSRPVGRNIPASIRRAVAKRDGERCTYASRSGRRCNATDFLEFHHVIPWGRNRSHEVDNITLRCRAHNQYAAELDFGGEHMARFRRSGSGDSAGSSRGCASEGASVNGQLDLSPVGRPNDHDLGGDSSPPSATVD